jgi:hypothetical protein
MHHATTQPKFVLVVTPEGDCDNGEAYRRLKALLKAALRSYKLRCLSVQTSAGTASIDPPGGVLGSPPAT